MNRMRPRAMAVFATALLAFGLLLPGGAFVVAAVLASLGLVLFLFSLRRRRG